MHVFYMLDIGQRGIEIMFPVYRYTDENKDYLSIYLATSDNDEDMSLSVGFEAGQPSHQLDGHS